MKHHKAKRSLGRDSNQYRALLRSLACALIKNEGIVTTEAKAKELRPYVEKLVTNAKKGTIPARRLVNSKLTDETMTKKLVDTIAPSFKGRAGGYTRITKMPIRGGDAAKMAHIEFVK
jgi:large subunit ribosomal protein L17